MAPSISGGTQNSGTTSAVTYTWPSHQNDDILIMALESSTTALTTPSTPSGMAHVTGSPRSQTSNATSITAFWKRAASFSESNVIVPAAVDHQDGIPFRIRGGLLRGTPWDASTSSGQSSGTGTRTFSGFNTLTANSLVVYMIACELDSLTDNFGTLNTPSGLTSFSVLDRIATDVGGGGGLIVASGIKTTVGNTGNLTWTFSNAAAWSGIGLAFPPALDFEGWGVSL